MNAPLDEYKWEDLMSHDDTQGKYVMNNANGMD